MNSPVEITTDIMSLGFTRDQAGTLASGIYSSIKYKDPIFIELVCKMFKDTRYSKWGNESGLVDELKNRYNLV